MRTKLKQWAGMAALVLGAAGCMVGPDHSAPNARVPADWEQPLAGGVGTNAPAAGAQWWREFQDPKLSALVARAFATNLDLRIAETRVRQARAQAGMAEGDLGPVVRTTGGAERERWARNGFPPLPPYVASPETDLYTAGFDASWEIDVFGGRRRAREAARAGVAAQELGRADARVSLVAEVARNYVAVRAAQRQLLLAAEQIRAQEETVTVTKGRVDQGAATDLDWQRARALLAALKGQVPRWETSRDSAVHRLGVLLDASPGALASELAEPVVLPGELPVVPAGLPSDLLKRRPDLRRAERQLAAETARIGQARADWFPKFFLTGTAGLTSVSGTDLFEPGSRMWSIGPSVQWRIFDYGRVRSQVRAQRAVADQAGLAYEQAVLNALEDVANALTAYAKEQEHRHWLAEAVAADEQAVGLAQKLYANGLGNYLMLLDAQRTLYSAQADLVASESAVATDYVALQKALGR